MYRTIVRSEEDEGGVSVTTMPLPNLITVEEFFASPVRAASGAARS